MNFFLSLETGPSFEKILLSGGDKWIRRREKSTDFSTGRREVGRREQRGNNREWNMLRQRKYLALLLR